MSPFLTSFRFTVGFFTLDVPVQGQLVEIPSGYSGPCVFSLGGFRAFGLVVPARVRRFDTKIEMEHACTYVKIVQAHAPPHIYASSHVGIQKCVYTDESM